MFVKHRKYYKIIAISTITVSSIWAFDKYFYYSTLTRNLNTLWTGLIITADYKINFTRQNSDKIDQLHERTAKRILELCKNNGGLYIKFGQQMATVPVLPAPYLRHLKQLYDKAPCFDYHIVEKIFLDEFGILPNQIFKEFAKDPVASASIAQVHRATLKSGEFVAVKIQKPEIEKQTIWDMLGYRVVLRALEYFFDLPLYWTADYIEKHLREEVDFRIEVKNAEKCSMNIQQVELKRSTYVPKIFHDICSKHVMTTEWIDGISLANREEFEQSFGGTKKKIMSTIVNIFADVILC
jgi:aarF domain-containing kinase